MWFTVLVAVSLLVHFSLTLVYSVPAMKVPAAVRDKAYVYSYPFFHQTWSLFAPDLPEYDVDLEFRVFHQQAWTAYTDASEALEQSSGSTAETLEQAMCSGLAYQLANNMYTSNGQRQLEHVLESKLYGRAIYFAHGVAQRLYGRPVGDSLQMRLQFRFTPAPEAARNYQFSAFAFPAYALPKAEVAP